MGIGLHNDTEGEGRGVLAILKSFCDKESYNWLRVVLQIGAGGCIMTQNVRGWGVGS